MLAKKNENIKEAYEILQKVSKSKEARMAYEARQAEIMDQLTREETAKEEGREEGREEEKLKSKKEKLEIAKGLIGILDENVIAEKFQLSIDEVDELKKWM